MCASHWENETQRRNESEGLIANSRRDPVVYVDLGNFVGIAWAHLRDVYASEGWAYLERTRWDPKDGELCLVRTKSGETLMEVRSDSDVQIDRQNWV
jgi:hypothetical protein